MYFVVMGAHLFFFVALGVIPLIQADVVSQNLFALSLFCPPGCCGQDLFQVFWQSCAWDQRAPRHSGHSRLTTSPITGLPPKFSMNQWSLVPHPSLWAGTEPGEAHKHLHPSVLRGGLSGWIVLIQCFSLVLILVLFVNNKCCWTE